MGWKESDEMSERLEFVRLAEVEGVNLAALCRSFGVSRKTGYKWLKRWRLEGKGGLENQSRQPHHSPLQTNAEVEQLVVELRKKHPLWGGRTLRRILQNQRHAEIPSPSSITRILHRHGLISVEDSCQRKSFESFERPNPNDLWQIDFKGDFKLANGQRCYPLTLLDDHSRYSLGIIACENQQRGTVQPHFRQVFQKYGIPRAIYVDNGNPWGTSGQRSRHSRLSAWLMRQDIEVIHGRPYCPQGRGKIERFHRTLKREVLQDRQLVDLTEAQRAFDPWRSLYNHERPHQGLELEVPSSRYRISERPFKEVTGQFEYSDRFEVRRLHKKTGQFAFKGQTYRLSEAFLDQPIGFSPTQIDGVWDIYYCRFRIAQLDQRAQQIKYDRHLAESRSARSSQVATDGKTTPKH